MTTILDAKVRAVAPWRTDETVDRIEARASSAKLSSAMREAIAALVRELRAK